MKAIEIENLNKIYNNRVQALSDVSFYVSEGEVFGLVGPDGGGKSTIFNILATLLLPTSGQASVLSRDVVNDAKIIRQLIGYLPGVFSLYPDLTVEENLIFFATMYKSRIKDNLPLIRPIWKQLVPFKDRRAGKLSGGMKQKLALCCALIHKPALLLLDEPTTGVDPVSRAEFWDILTNIQKQGITVLVSTPYMDEATRCDRIALIQEGKIIKIDTPTNIMEAYRGFLYTIKVENVFSVMEKLKEIDFPCNYYPYGQELHIAFYEAPEIVLQKFCSFLREQNIKFEELSPIQPTIEDCFIELVKLK